MGRGREAEKRAGGMGYVIMEFYGFDGFLLICVLCRDE